MRYNRNPLPRPSGQGGEDVKNMLMDLKNGIIMTIKLRLNPKKNTKNI
jgi:hypothetical protein